MSDSQHIDPRIPFVLPPVIPTTRNTKCGRGVIVPVTVAVNTKTTITHNLGRKVQGMIALLNNGGASPTPYGLWFGTSPTSTSTQQSIISPNVALTNCLLWVF
jgi:hypothetical protein